jgi:S-DNA-T family DNA segregation ATPase FtsK/SpoIIIE
MMTRPPGPSAERFQLRITIRTTQHECDVIVEAATVDRLSSLADRGGERLGAGPGLTPWCERRGKALDREQTMAEASVRWGDRLLLVPRVATEPTSVGGAPRVELAVTGGPCSGQVFTLGEGTFTIGREAGSDVTLADPSLSRRHASISVEGTRVSVTDLDSSNGVAIDGRAIEVGRAAEVDALMEIELGRTLIRVSPIDLTARPEPPVRDGRVEFNRPPRVNRRTEPFLRELPAPPSRGGRPRLPFAAALLPTLAGVVMFLLLKSPFLLVMCALSPLMAITTYVSDRHGRHRSFGRGSAEFRERLAAAVSDLDHALAEEAQGRREEAPDSALLFDSAAGVEPTLWERRPGDLDFLSLRLGVADLPARSRVVIADGGSEDLRQQAQAELAGRLTVAAVPLCVDFCTSGVVGLAGPRSVTAGLARALVTQAACLHSPADLRIVAAIGDGAAAEWSWLKWLPHSASDQSSVPGGMSAGEKPAAELLGALGDLIEDRHAQRRDIEGRAGTWPTTLVVIDEDAHVQRGLVSAVLTDGVDVGIVVLWLGHAARGLPSSMSGQDNRSMTFPSMALASASRSASLACSRRSRTSLNARVRQTSRRGSVCLICLIWRRSALRYSPSGGAPGMADGSAV